MITYKTGNIIREDVEALVNTVNCVGIMGRGVALQFKDAFPDNFKAYAEACKHQNVQPGRMFVFETGKLMNPRVIINFPTKRHWRGKSRIEDIDSGLRSLSEVIHNYNIRSIAIPPLGSGLGGLNWSDVRARIESTLNELNDCNIIIFEPFASKTNVQTHFSSDIPKMTPGRAALIGLIEHYLNGLLDPYITLLEVHKLMYFMQQAGEPLRLDYKKGPYGPYAENLRHVLKAMEGYQISGYTDRGDIPDTPLKLVPGALDDASSFLKDNIETKKHIAKVSDLVNGFESSFGLELLSTVHWIVCMEHTRNMDDIVDQVYAWNNRKKQFSKRQINLAVNILANKGWIEHPLASD